MDYIKIPLDTPLIDSLSLKIKLDDVIVLDERLTSKTFYYYESLEKYDASNVMPPKPIVISQNGITVRIQLIQIPIYNSEIQQKIDTQFVQLTLSSKLLKERYFEGITKDNLKDLYNSFIQMSVFDCSFETFINGQVNDIDICINKRINPILFQDLLSYINNSLGTKKRFSNFINNNENLGLALNERYKAKPSTPFIKYYFKTFELLTKSAEFYNTYLFKHYANEIENLSRIECTLKNYKHKQRLINYKIIDDFKTLLDLVNLPNQQLLNFVTFSCSSYIEKTIRLKAPDLSPTDFIIYNLIENSINKGYDIKELLSIANNFTTHKIKSQEVAQSRIRKKIKEMFNLLINRDFKIQAKSKDNQQINDYLRFLKII